jgi:branched-chain amino acid transport system substrate-binding protein
VFEATRTDMSRRSSTAAALVALIATLAAACTGGGPSPSPVPDPVPVKIAFLHDMSVPGSAQTVAPALLGLQLAFQEAVDAGDLPVVPEVVELDVVGDDGNALELAHEIAGDPTYVAAVVGPFWSEPVDVGDVLHAAGVPTISVSELDPSLATRGWSSWRRIVAGLSHEAAALAAVIRASPQAIDGVCVVGDGSGQSSTIGELLGANLGSRVTASLDLPDEDALSDVVQRIDRSGCGLVAWTGFSPGATSLRSGLTEAGSDPLALVGSSAMKTDLYLSTTDDAGDGTIVTCACVDLGSSTRPDARRFIHDFQSRFGSPPGVFGAEGWDAGGMLLATFRAGARDRRTVAAALSTIDGYEGLANTYRFDEDGELEPGSAQVHVFRAEGVRWDPVGGEDTEEPLPVGTPGYLSVAACRKGGPFASTSGGRLTGFDVELAAAIARRLGLMLSWRDLPCETALRAVSSGTLDAVLTPSADVGQGTPASGIALSLHLALVTSKHLAHDDRPLLQHLGPGDVVVVVRSREGVAWANSDLRATGAEVRFTADRQTAYEELVAGSVTAVADVEPEAWLAIERRRSLRVAQSIDVGAYDVFVAKGPDARLVAAIDESLARLIRVGRYALLFAKYFPGTPLPSETGS